MDFSYFYRLQELEQQMVGGEEINNVEVKERRKKRKTFAEERKRKLAGKICLQVFQCSYRHVCIKFKDFEKKLLQFSRTMSL